MNAMPLFGQCFLSDVLKKPVFDRRGEVAGRVTDVTVVKGEHLPKVSAILVARDGGAGGIPWRDMEMFNKRILSTRLDAGSIQPYEAGEEALLAVRDILDKQIVDVNGAKVVRVNDIRLEGYNSDAVLTAVDVGVRGLLRRIGLERQSERVFSLLKVQLPANLISWNYLQPLSPKLKAIALTVPRRMLAELHPADIAEIISEVSREEGTALLTDLDIKTAGETLSELNPQRQVELVTAIAAEKAADIIEEMPPDEASDVLGDLPTEKAKEILEHIEQDEAEDIQELLAYEEDTAGGLMTNAFLAYPPAMTVGEALQRFKLDGSSVDPVYQIYVVDAHEKLVGAISLRELLLADSSRTLGALAPRKPRTVKPEADEKTIATVMSKYHLIALPVVNPEGRLLGVVTIDDIIDRLRPSSAKRRRKGA